MTYYALAERSLISLTGADVRTFLQGVITNDIRQLSPKEPLYACLLNPQGKILFDFFLYDTGDALLLDVWSDWAEALLKKLTMYKLRSDVALQVESSLGVAVQLDIEDELSKAIPLIDVSDPRLRALPKRAVFTREALASFKEGAEMFKQQQIVLAVADSADFREGRAFTSEYGIADLQGVSYSKGCYVGQEVVSRSKIRGQLRKALHHISGSDAIPAKGVSIMSGEKEIGQVVASDGNRGVAMLKIDAVTKAEITKTPLISDRVVLTAALPEWFAQAHDAKKTLMQAV